MKLIRKVDILGSKYAVYRVGSGENEYMERMHYGGLCCAGDRKIYILDLATVRIGKTKGRKCVRARRLALCVTR